MLYTLQLAVAPVKTSFQEGLGDLLILFGTLGGMYWLLRFFRPMTDKELLRDTFVSTTYKKGIRLGEDLEARRGRLGGLVDSGEVVDFKKRSRPYTRAVGE